MDYPKSVPGVGLSNGKFVDDNPITGAPGSLIPASWGNGVTDEIVNVIQSAGLVPDEKKNDQLLKAVQNVASTGWNLDIALPLVSLPPATIASPDGRLSVTPTAVVGTGGNVSIPGGVLLSIGQEVIAGKLGRSRAFTTSAWTSQDLLPATIYFLRAQVIGGALTFYVQKGALADVQPESLRGTVNGVAGGGFVSTPIDMCIAAITTGAVGTVPMVRQIYNRPRLSWTQALNGSGVIYLPLDPHARNARLTVGATTPSPSVVSLVSFAPSGWLGGNYSYLNPSLQGIGNWDGWSTPSATCFIFSPGDPADVTISTLTASFDHTEVRSLWQVYQAEHTLGSSNASSDELLLGWGLRAIR